MVWSRFGEKWAVYQLRERKSSTTKATKGHDGIDVVRFSFVWLRVASCPSWVVAFKFTHY
jgi:hypothetical protein